MSDYDFDDDIDDIVVLAACTGACAAGVACAMCWPAGRYLQSIPSYVPPPPTPYPSEQVTAMYVPPSYAPSAPIYPPTGVTATVPVHFGGPPLHWVDTKAYGSFPSTALRGGLDIDGQIIYVGRAFHNGDWLPAKIVPGRRVAYVSYGGKEIIKDHFQILCEQRFEWVHDCNGRVPFNAVEGGRTSTGERLFVGRVYHNGSQTIGKIHPSHGVCYIPFDGREMSFTDYEVLIRIV